MSSAGQFHTASFCWDQLRATKTSPGLKHVNQGARNKDPIPEWAVGGRLGAEKVPSEFWSQTAGMRPRQHDE